MEVHKDAIISMAIESWRFGRVFDRLLTKLDAGEQKRYKSQLRWFMKKKERKCQSYIVIEFLSAMLGDTMRITIG